MNYFQFSDELITNVQYQESFDLMAFINKPAYV